MKKNEETGAQKPEEKKEIPITKVKEKTLAQLLDEKLTKIQEVQKLSNDLLYLRKTQNKFTEFVIGSDGQSDHLTIEDSQRRRFETTNSDTIKRVTEILKVDLCAKIVETEQKLTEASI
jgi:hypothetical protein